MLKNVEKGTKIFTKQNVYIALSILLPVLSIYVSPIAGLDLGTACILVFSLFLLGSKTTFRLNAILSILLVYTFLVTIPAVIGFTTNYSSETIVLFRMMRFILLIIIMIGIGYTSYYDEKKYTRAFEVIAIIVSSYAIIQSVFFKLTGIKLRNIFGQERGGAVFSASLGEYENVYRPPSFFLEPSSVSYFLTPILCYVLFCDKKLSIKKLIIALLITISILVSTSGQGLLIVALCWGIWGITRIRYINIGGLLIFVMCAFLVFNKIDLKYTISRLTTEEESNAVNARSGGYEMVKEMNPEAVVFGNGYGNYDESIYYSSFAEIIFCTGYVGLILVIVLLGWLFLKGVAYQKVLILASILLMAGGGIYTATYLCLYLPMLLPRVRKATHNSDTKCIQSV